ncbi:hypothetical protein OG404_08680 [Streptomyces griseoaurantiacus]|uniref:WXG100 family type VII secretion target n=1 Tax=Streptomyces griseoaurantiacus TaxID=68213 RepID=UPI00352D276C
MGEQRHNREPKLARTDFESMTHEQLAALLASANTAGASHLSSKLSKAASTITKIGDDLMTYVKGLEWQGEGGDAFRDWGGQTASSTLRLGQYAEVAARWMGTVSQAIAEAKAAMPDVSETTRAKTDLADAHKTITAANQPGGHNDPDAQKLAATARTDATAAEHRMEAARGEAIQQLRKLAQTYEYSAQQVNSVAPPTFSPPVENAGSRDWWDDEGSAYLPDGSRRVNGGVAGSEVSGNRVSGATTHAGTTGTSLSVPERSASGAATPHSYGPAPTALDLDGVSTLPKSSAVNATGPAGPHNGMPHQPPSAPDQSPAPPTAFSTGGRVSGQNLSPRTTSPARLPQTTTPGGIANGRVPRVPQDTGIIGGRAISSNLGRPQNSIPRGTVIGKEGTPMGRTSPMRGVSSAHGTEGAGPSRGPLGGRRLASEAGGIVGSNPGQPGRSRKGPFTPGGSGLVRPGAGVAEGRQGAASERTGNAAKTSRTGPVTNPARSSPKDKDQQRGSRPDYVVEDEETWMRDDRPPLPPVIG